MEKEKPLPWSVFIGCVLTMLSLFLAFAVNITILGQPLRTLTDLPPYGRDLLQPIANVLALALIVLGIVLMYTGLKKTK